MSLNTQAWLAILALAVVMGLLLFVPAGSLRYWHAWVYLAIFNGASILTTLDLMKRDPALLKRRMRGGPTAEKEATQRLIMVFTSLGFIALLVVPIQMSLIPILQIYSAGNLYGSFLGIWLAHTGFGLPLAIFLLYNYMSQLPRDLFESAAIDGATHLQTFMRLVLPLSIPALGAIAIFQFLWVWNDLLVALVFLGPGADVRVLPTALYNLIGSRGGSWHLLTAGAFITMIVPLIVFLLLQRAFVRGILAGSVKS